MKQRKQRLLTAVFFLGTLSLACRDLSVRDPGSGDGGAAGPEITPLSPLPPNVAPLSAFVSLRVEDALGVSSVELLCGNVSLQKWQAEPYEATVDLTPCRGASPPDGGQDIQSITLTVNATDGARPPTSSSKSFSILVDTSIAALTLALPARVAPGAPLQIGIQSDRELKAPPVVSVDGTPLDVGPGTAGSRSWLATLAATPGLGADLYDAGVPDGGPWNIPYDVLSQTERALPVIIDATATSGHVTHIETELPLSRFAWDVAVPGLPMSGQSPSAWPVGTDGGLQLAIALDTSYNTWQPGFLSAADGRYAPFSYTDPDPVDQFFDGGVQLQAIDALGRTLVTHANPDGGFQLVYHSLAPGTNQPVGQSGSVYFAGLGFTRVGQALCQESITTYGSCGGAVTQRALTCIDPSQLLRTGVLSNGSEHSTTLSTASMGSGNNFLGLESPATCDVPTLLMMNPPTLATELAPPVSAVYRLLPVGDGSFALHTAATGATGLTTYRAYVIGPTGGSGGAYSLPQVYYPGNTYPGVPPSEIVAARPDRSLIRIHHHDPSYTTFELYPSNGAGMIASARIPGYFDYSATIPSPTQLPFNVVMYADGSFSVLLEMQTFVYAVASFDANLRPRWIYKYPRLVVGTPQLVGGDGSQLYLVDPGNGYAVAFYR